MSEIEEHIEFTTIREEFSEYEIENGQILKIKKVLTDIVKQPTPDDSSRTGLKIQDITHVITTKPIDTEGMVGAVSSSITDDDIVENLSFRSKKSMINIYETEKSIILLDVQIIKIGSTNKLDQTGNPYLRFKSTFGVNIVAKPKDETKSLEPN